MSTIYVRGRKIKVQAKAGTQRAFVMRLYEALSDERLDELEQESQRHEETGSWTSSRTTYRR